MASSFKVFISYAHADAAALAVRLFEDLQKANVDPWLDTSRLAAGASWSREIEKAVDGSEVMLALLTDGSYQSDVCRAEQLRALRRGKRVIPILAQPASEIPLHLESSQYCDLSHSENYCSRFSELLADIQEGRGAIQLIERFRHTYVTAPPLPRNYVERPEDLARLRSALLTDGSGPSIAVTALKGMGGIGKTVLAQALCHDEVVQQAFPDGIVWVTAGREPTYDLVTRMREVRRAFDDRVGAAETELECINRYRNVLREKAALVVVDDVWTAHDIEPFRAESPRSRILFTTRDASIAAAVGAEEHLAHLLTEEQAQDVIARWSGLQVSGLPVEAAEIVRECGRLPLSLSMIGAMLRGKPREYWKHVQNLLRDAELARISTDFPNYAHKNLLRAMEVSVDALDPQARDRYRALAVLLDDTPIPPAIQQVLWVADELDAVATAERFISLSLAQRDTHEGGIRLHDLQLDYLRAQYPDKHALHLIQGAVRLSSRTIERDPQQFPSQVIGRLLSHGNQEGVQRFTTSLRAGTRGPFLRLLNITLYPPGTALIRTLEGHFGSVNHVALTPDGLRVVSGSWDNTVRVWDLESGRELHTLSGHSASVPCVAVAPDGLHAVSASEDDTLKIWDLSLGREVRTLGGHGGSVNAVTVTPDGRFIVSGSWDKTVRVWDFGSGRATAVLRGHAAAVTSLAMTADGRRIISGSADHTIRVWDLESGRELHELSGGHSDVVFSVAVCLDEPWIISASRDKSLVIWDLDSGRQVRTLEGHSDYVYGVAASSAELVVSASRDRTLKVWDLLAGRERRTLKGHSAAVTSVAVSADGHQAVSASWDKTLRVWDLKSGPEVHTLVGHSRFVSSVAISQNGRRGISACWDTTLKVWDVESGSEIRTLSGHAAAVDGVTLSRDGGLAISASQDTTLRVWDVESGRLTGVLDGHANAVSGVALSPDARLAISASRDSTLKLWDLDEGRELRTFVGHSDGVLGVQFAPDGQHVISTSADATLKVWDIQSGRQLLSLRGHTELVSGAAITPDGRLVVSASWDQTVKIWDLESGRNVRTLEAHTDRVSGIALTADGRIAVSASADKTLIVWDVSSGRKITTFTCDSPAYCCAITGNRIMAGDQAGRVHFLLLESRD